MTPTQRKALEQALECLHDNRYYLIDRERREYLALYDKAIDDAEAALAEQPESLNWASLNKAADEIVRSKLIWKRFIDGTPLANDIACWMADFALEHTAPQPAKPAEQEPVAWIDITDEGQIVSSPRMYSDGSREERPLYTSPQPRRRLTDEEICAALDIDGSDDWTFTVAYAIIDAYERKNGVQT